MQKLPSFMCDDYDTDKCELLIDYYMSWTFRCAQECYESLDFNVNSQSKKVLSKCLFNHEDCLKNRKIVNVKCGKNCGKGNEKIDLWVEVEIENDKKIHVLIVETKMYTQIGQGQLEKYKEFVNEYYKGKKNKYDLKYILLRIEDYSNAQEKNDKIECKHAKYRQVWLAVIHYDILKILGETGNILFDEFWFRWWSKEYVTPSRSENEIFGL